MNGTLNVLRSCTKVPSIRRVVVTSSIVATIFNGKTLTPDVIVDETWFSDPAFVRNQRCVCLLISQYLSSVSLFHFQDVVYENF